MRYIADLHIHSLYSRATSKASHLHGLAAWANIKGIQVLGTGDFTHPGWFQYLKDNLAEAEPGFFRLRTDSNQDLSVILPEGIQPKYFDIRFILTAEISSIYKKYDKVRKIHNIIFVPDFQSAERINKTLSGIGNLESDGRPILGLDSRNLLEIVLENSEDGFLVPAHIWTPWFSLFGSKSGFNTIDECFADLSGHIFALETGLSSDPDMNRCISALDGFALISNSDCHSPAKLGREANILNTGFDYYAMRDGLRSPMDENGSQVFAATIEFFPEEGKYHCDGHRKCDVCLEPAETNSLNGLCPLCGRPVTIGVLSRVMELADRKTPCYPPGSPRVYSLVPLVEILSELLGTGPATKKVLKTYAQLIRKFGSEFNILLQVPLQDIAAGASHILSAAIDRVRKGNVLRKPGFDGEFGKITVFSAEERRYFGGQLNLFGVRPAKAANPLRIIKKITRTKDVGVSEHGSGNKKRLNLDQLAVVNSDAKRIIVKAGPGTGKTHTLVERVVRSLRGVGTPCTIITFTNKAADEVAERVRRKLDHKMNNIFIGTFHGFCLGWLRQEAPDLKIVGPQTRFWILQSIHQQYGNGALKTINRDISLFLRNLTCDKDECPKHLQAYFQLLQAQKAIDIDEVVPRMLALLNQGGAMAARARQHAGALFIDEFQDLNHVQYKLICSLARTSPVFAIGDPDQAVYGFRGSDPAFFYKFIEELQPEVYVLSRNYRCGKMILKAAQALIGQNRVGNEADSIQAVRQDNGFIYLYKADTEKDEADFIVDQIEKMLGGTSHREIDKLSNKGKQVRALNEIAVLYRTSRQAGVIVNALERQGIPYQVIDIQPFYIKDPVKTLYLFVLVAAGVDEPGDFFDLLRQEKKIGAQSIRRAKQYVEAGSRNNLDLLIDILQDKKSEADRLWNGLNKLHYRILFFKRQVADAGIRSGLLKIIKEYDLAEDDKGIERFLRLALTFGASLDDFAQHLLRYSETIIYDERAQSVTLLTLHAAKGLEFPAVFIVGMEEGLLPLLPGRSSISVSKEHLLEEERRLFFVGITRAIDVLFLSYAAARTIFGKKEARIPSRFLKEIPDRFFTHLASKKRGKKMRKTAFKQLELF